MKTLLSPNKERSMRMQQMINHRPLAELDLLDDFLFNALLAYPEYGRKFCRKFLKILFGREFKNLNIVFLFSLVDSVFCAKCPHCNGCSGENAQQCHREFGQVS